MAVQMTVQINPVVTLYFRKREERIVAFFFRVISSSGSIPTRLAEDLIERIDEKTCIGEISGPAVSLKMFLDVFCVGLVDVSLELGVDDFAEGSEYKETLELFDGLEQRVGLRGDVELNMYEMMSEDQRYSVRKTLLQFGKSFPSHLQYNDLPELSGS